MEVYIIAFLLLIVLAIGLLIWVIRLFLLYRKGKKKTAVIELIILLAILVPLSWESHIFPFSKNFYIKDRTTELTGYEFWSWKEFDFEEMSVRGEGYTLKHL